MEQAFFHRPGGCCWSEAGAGRPRRRNPPSGGRPSRAVCRTCCLRAQILPTASWRAGLSPHHRSGIAGSTAWGIVGRQFLAGRARGADAAGLSDGDGPLPVRARSQELADDIEENIRRRIELTAWYQRELPRLGFAGGAGHGADAGWPLLRYPLRVANKCELLSLAAEARRGDRLLVRVALTPRAETHTGGFWLSGRHVSPGGGGLPRRSINLPDPSQSDPRDAPSGRWSFSHAQRPDREGDER